VLVGAEVVRRLRLANEGSARSNIAEGVAELAALGLAPAGRPSDGAR